MEAAAELCEAGRFDDAEAEYARVLAQAPGQSVALLGLADCARNRGDLERSLLLHQQIVAADADHVWARLQMAADLRNLTRLDEAERAYHSVLANNPSSDAAFLGLGQCARRRQNRAAALAWHQLAANANPRNEWCRLECAVDQREMGDLAAARKTLSSLLASTPNRAAVLLALAHVERLAGERPPALDLLRQAANADPTHIPTLLELAAAHREAAAFDEAARVAHAVLEREPGNLPALISLGQTEQAAGRYNDALAAYTRAHLLAPFRADLLALMAVSERALGNQARCDALLAQALAAEPGNPAILVHQAEQARMAHDIARMHAIYAAALADDARHLALNLGYAESLVLLGRHAEALAHLDQTETAIGHSTVLAITTRRPASAHRTLARGACGITHADRRRSSRCFSLDGAAVVRKLSWHGFGRRFLSDGRPGWNQERAGAARTHARACSGRSRGMGSGGRGLPEGDRVRS